MLRRRETKPIERFTLGTIGKVAEMFRASTKEALLTENIMNTPNDRRSERNPLMPFPDSPTAVVYHN